jgi:hypothetical protein
MTNIKKIKKNNFEKNIQFFFLKNSIMRKLKKKKTLQNKKKTKHVKKQKY